MIAEGIETEEQRYQLRLLGLKLGHLSRLVTPAEAREVKKGLTNGEIRIVLNHGVGDEDPEVVAVAGVIDAKDEDTAVGVGTVTLYGTLAILTKLTFDLQPEVARRMVEAMSVIEEMLKAGELPPNFQARTWNVQRGAAGPSGAPVCG